MSPLEAAVAWLEVQEMYGDRELVSPATGHLDTEWFDQFMAECEVLGCRFDYVATHWYGNAQGVSAEYTMSVRASLESTEGCRQGFTLDTEGLQREIREEDLVHRVCRCQRSRRGDHHQLH